MRRPLFGTGLPKAAPEGVLTEVLSLGGLSPEIQSRVQGVTLYALISPGVDEAGLLVLASPSDATIADLGASAKVVGSGGGPSNPELVVQKVLDRFPLRGDSKVSVLTTGDRPVHLVGYFQLEGERALPIEYRPLQPSAGEVEDDYTGSGITLAVGETLLQAFTQEKIDIVALRAAGLTADDAPTLVFRDGVGEVEIPVLTGSVPASSFPAFLDVLSGIPFRANGPGGGISIRSISANSTIFAWGLFIRG